MTVHFATDHAGFALKNVLVSYVRDELGYEVVDHGAHEYDAADDYPGFIAAAARAVAGSPADRAIVLGGSGQGEAMAANRFSGVRATVYYGGEADIITLSREHNNANVLSLGARFVSEAEAMAVVASWLSHTFSGEERHVRRINQLDRLSDSSV